MNKVIMTGNLGKDPEVRYNTGATQQAICRFPLAVSDRGDKETTWVHVVSFGKTAENCEKFLSKGRKVAVDGRLQIRKYQKQDGSEGTAIEVVANSVEFLSGHEQQAPGWGQQVQQTQQAWTQEVQFQTPETYGKSSQAQQPQWSAPQQAPQQQSPQQQAMPGFMQVDEDIPF